MNAMKTAITCALMLVVLAGCGGGGGSPDNPTPVPAGWGRRDVSYGSNGIASVGMAGHFAYRRFAFAPDGSTYVAPNASVVKVDPRGSVVSSFGTGGQVTLPFRYTTAHSPVVDAAGNVYVPMGLGATKIRADGSPAADFGNLGFFYEAAPDGSSWMNSLARDNAGAVYAAGSQYVAKFDSAGHLDRTYGVGGMHILVLGSGDINDIQVDAQGNAYLAASTSAQGAVVIKLNAAGFLAADFGANGVWASGCRGSASTIAITSSGQLIVGVNCSAEADAARRTAFVFKVDPQGNTVVDYRDGGSRSLFGVSVGYVYKVVSLASGEVFIAGFRPKPGNQAAGCDSTAAAMKLDARGETVPAFDASAVLFLDGEYATDLGLDSAGSLYVAATRRNSCDNHPPAGSVGAIYKLSP
jgi:hypothetical protein